MHKFAAYQSTVCNTRLLWRYRAILAGFLTSPVTDIGVAENQIWVVLDMTSNYWVTAETTKV